MSDNIPLKVRMVEIEKRENILEAALMQCTVTAVLKAAKNKTSNVGTT
jgi:hypothetical protein